MPTTILDNETYQDALHRRYTEESETEERMTTKPEKDPAALDALYAALPFVEDALEDEAYKKERVSKVLSMVLKAIKSTENAHAQQAKQEPFDMDDHPPHRLCECRKCMEYFTPLPDCDAFAASGKPIAEQTNTQLMEGYRIGLAEMREKCAKSVYHSTDWAHEERDMVLKEAIAAAIRAIKFEGDTGFRPVSEMIAEHKQDPKKAAAIEKAKMRKAEQKPVAIDGLARACNLAGIDYKDFLRIKAYLPIATPVRTKDLTGQDLCDLEVAVGWEGDSYDFEVIAKAVVDKLREKR